MSTEVASYLMTPGEDVIVFGADLAEGMWVLPEDEAGRQAVALTEEAQLRCERFRRVTRLRTVLDAGYAGGACTVFVGEWVDGYQKVCRVSVETAWIAKKDSLPDAPEAAS